MGEVGMMDPDKKDAILKVLKHIWFIGSTFVSIGLSLFVIISIGIRHC